MKTKEKLEHIKYQLDERLNKGEKEIMDLKGKMELVIGYRYGNVKFDKSCNNEEELKEFINDLLKSVKEDLENGYSGDYEIIEVINNLGY